MLRTLTCLVFFSRIPNVFIAVILFAFRYEVGYHLTDSSCNTTGCAIIYKHVQTSAQNHSAESVWDKRELHTVSVMTWFPRWQNRQLLRDRFMVELVEGSRKLRHVFLFTDLLLCTKLKKQAAGWVWVHVQPEGRDAGLWPRRSAGFKFLLRNESHSA